MLLYEKWKRQYLETVLRLIRFYFSLLSICQIEAVRAELGWLLHMLGEVRSPRNTTNGNLHMERNPHCCRFVNVTDYLAEIHSTDGLAEVTGSNIAKANSQISVVFVANSNLKMKWNFHYWGFFDLWTN